MDQLPNKDSKLQWCGYTVQQKQDLTEVQRRQGVVGYVVIKDGLNVMPGAAWFHTTQEAQKGIAALEIAKAICPDETVKHPTLPATNLQAHLFWMFVTLDRKDK